MKRTAGAGSSTSKQKSSGDNPSLPGIAKPKATQKKGTKGKGAVSLAKLLQFDRAHLAEHALGGQPILVGVDEVGRGCLAGPVVACAVILPDLNPRSAHFKGLAALNDSKQIKPEVRQELSTLLRQSCRFAIADGSVEEIDTINILRASLLAMLRALTELTLPPDALVLVDGNQRIPELTHHQTTVTAGDATSASIAAASIIAKVYRDELMCKLAADHPQYMWQKNKGYGSAVHRQAIADYGITRWHRTSFSMGMEEEDDDEVTCEQLLLVDHMID